MDLPYLGHELSMTIMLPDEGRYREFEDSLDAALITGSCQDYDQQLPRKVQDFHQILPRIFSGFASTILNMC